MILMTLKSKKSSKSVISPLSFSQGGKSGFKYPLYSHRIICILRIPTVSSGSSTSISHLEYRESVFPPCPTPARLYHLIFSELFYIHEYLQHLFSTYSTFSAPSVPVQHLWPLVMKFGVERQHFTP